MRCWSGSLWQDPSEALGPRVTGLFWIREKNEEAELKAGLKLVFEEGWVKVKAAELAHHSPFYSRQPLCGHHLSLPDSLLTTS